MKKKIRFVSLESAAFLLDLDYQTMTCEERGAYCHIILNLNENDGCLPMDKVLRSSFCNCPDFENVFEKIKHKFLIKDGKISHKRVLAELRRARKISQLQREKGLKSAEARRLYDNDRSTGVQPGFNHGSTKRSEGEAKGSEEKVSEGKGEAQEKSSEEKKVEAHYASPSSPSDDSSQRPASPPAPQTTETMPTDFTMKLIYLNDGLCKIFPQRTPADTSSIRNLANWVINRIKLGKFQDKIIGNVLAIARDSKKGKSRKPIAVFYAQLKTDLGYK